MTRNEFINDIVDWGELKDVDNEYGFYILEDIYSNDSRDEYINDELYNDVRHNNYTWLEIRGWLDDLDTGYGNGWWQLCDGDWYDVSEEVDLFEDRKNDLLCELDEAGLFDEDDEAEGTADNEEAYMEVAEAEVPDEDFGIDVLFDTCIEESMAWKVIPRVDIPPKIISPFEEEYVDTATQEMNQKTEEERMERDAELASFLSF